MPGHVYLNIYIVKLISISNKIKINLLAKI